ncbi:MAG: 2OG-Fe(II) oxygenase, partial [bacterium]
MNTEKPGLGLGERAPDFVLPLADGTPTRFYALAGGKPTLLFFCKAEAELSRFSEVMEHDAPDEVAVFAVTAEEPTTEANVIPRDQVSFPVFSDIQGKMRAAYRLDANDKSILFVLDPNLRVVASFFLEEEAGVRKVAAVLDAAVPGIKPTMIVNHAPVLLIPNVLDLKICAELIDVWQNQGSEETGVEQSRGGRREETISHANKRRRDHIVMDRELLQRLTTTIGRRVMPEVRKAFAFKATRFEGFKIVCYDAATGGFFHAHRDNLSPATAHRRFAMTLNLNDDYDGGDLRFPEYGADRYRPGPGCALVFSCSHLHEVTEVTTGRRFALLSCLFWGGGVGAGEAQ